MYNLEKFNSLYDLTSYFKTESMCREFLADFIFPDGDYVCPYCGQHHCHKRKDGKFRCPHCLRNFSATKGTMFENTKIPLKKWFICMYIVSSHRKGISSYQVARDLKVTQKTAWYILGKIRMTLMQEESVVLENEVECDEAYIGGKEKYKHASKRVEGTQGRSLKTKTPVFGMVQRDGSVVSKKTDDVQGNTLLPIIKQFVKDGTRIYTDEYIGYNTLVESEYTHAVVNHGAQQYVDGDSHTNTIEGFWSQLKRSIYGIHHFVSAKYLQSYVDEAVFRYNNCTVAESVIFKNMLHKAMRVIRYNDVKNVA
jgi:transposase-like protein